MSKGESRGWRPRADELVTQWFNEHWGEMVECARRFPNRLATPEDIAQEALLAAYERWDKLRSANATRSWLLGFVRNIGRQYVRKTHRQARIRREHRNEIGTDPSATWLEEQVINGQRDKVLMVAEELPARQRAVVFMMIINQTSDAEIAKATGMTRAAIWQNRSRAVKKLRAILLRR